MNRTDDFEMTEGFDFYRKFVALSLNLPFVSSLIIIPVSFTLGHLLIWILFGPNILLLNGYNSVDTKIIVGLMRAFAIVAGAMFTFWLIVVIQKQGIVANGLELLIFVGVLSVLPDGIFDLLRNEEYLVVIGSVIAIILTTVFLVYLREGARRITVTYGRRVRGRKIYHGQATYIPLKLLPNSIEVIKVPILLILILLLPTYLISEVSSGLLQKITQSIYMFFRPDHLPFYLLVALILPIYLLFDSEVQLHNENLPETLQRQGGFIPGIRPGKRTEYYILFVHRRISVPFALMLTLIFLLNVILAQLTDISGMDVLFWSLAVAIVIDIIRKLDAILMMLNYKEGFIYGEQPIGDPQESAQADESVQL